MIATPAKSVSSYAEDMTLRDWFAGQAMAAIVAHQQHGDCEMTSREELAACAYEVADAMLAERDKGDAEEPAP